MRDLFCLLVFFFAGFLIPAVSFEQFPVLLKRTLNNHLRIVYFPFPFFGDRGFISSPAKDATVGAANRCCHLHALMALYSVEFQLVAAAFLCQHILCPAAYLHSRMIPDNPVLLLCQFILCFFCEHKKENKAGILKV